MKAPNKDIDKIGLRVKLSYGNIGKVTAVSNRAHSKILFVENVDDDDSAPMWIDEKEVVKWLPYKKSQD